MVWYFAAAALIFISPFSIGLRKACLLFVATVAVLALVTYIDGGMPGCFVVFECKSGEAYEGITSSFVIALVLLVYLGIALAAPLVQLLRWLGFRQR